MWFVNVDGVTVVRVVIGVIVQKCRSGVTRD
jgi:hypothetical protein